jgi:crotonobetainyl-CoA:carnitine CoA-transferase CaiB-like acyl-CoA transferase
VDLLAGIRVIDTSAYVFGPAAAGVLAHWGADVIKIESPKAIDPIRRDADPSKGSISFQHYNRAKRAIALDLASSDGREILGRLVEGADVFLTSLLPASRKKLRIEVEDVRQDNPRVIYVRASGQGPLGPDAQRPGFDLATWWSRGGLVSEVMRVSGATEPTGMVGHGDGISGLALAGGICAALLHLSRTGIAKTVDASLLATALWFNAPAIIGSRAPRLPSSWPAVRVTRDELSAGTNAYRTKDGRFIQVVMFVDRDDHWRDLCERVSGPELAADPRFASSRLRTENRAAAVAALDEAFARRTFEQCKTALAAATVAWSPVQLPGEIADDPQVIANGFIHEVDTPIGPLSLPIPALMFDEDGGRPARAPDFAQHTDEVLSEVGFSADDLARYRLAGVIA